MQQNTESAVAVETMPPSVHESENRRLSERLAQLRKVALVALNAVLLCVVALRRDSPDASCAEAAFTM